MSAKEGFKPQGGMMHCEKCGKTIDDNTSYCPHCGHRRPGTPAAPKRSASGLAIASLVLSAVGFNIAGIITGAIALQKRKPGRDLAKAGVIIGAARLALGMLISIFTIAAALIIMVGVAAEEKEDAAWCAPSNNAWVEPWEDDDTEMNIDTTWAGRTEAELSSLEARITALEMQESSDAEQMSAVESARNHVGQARKGLRALSDSPSGDDAEHIKAGIVTNRDAASAAVEAAGG